MTLDATRRWVAVTTLAVVSAMSLVVGAQQGPQGPGALFERARLLEENSTTLNEAIVLYKQVAAQAGSNRALAAQALLRAAESYQKLGDVQARGLYEQLVRDYGDQTDVVTLARTRLGGTAAVASAKGDRAVWTGPNVDATGRASADGRFITSVDWSNGRLMIHDVGRNTDRALTAAAPNFSQGAEWSALSKDGKQIVYEWNNGRAEVRIAALPGDGFLEPRQFILTDAAAFDSFDWSPDGKWIATAFRRTDGTGQIGVMAVSDGSFRSLKSVGRNAVARPLTTIFFSPDGRYLAYDVPTATSQQRDVFVLAVDGSPEIPAVAHSANDYVMGWSPDGTLLLFSSDRTGSWGLWAQAFADGRAQGTPELLRSEIGPSSSLGVTASGALYLYKEISTRDVAIAPVDLEAGRLLGPPVGFPEGFLEGAGNAKWSPDGRYLTYVVTCDNGCLAIRSVATGQVRRLAPTLSNVGVHAWSPDGRSLLTAGRDVGGRSGVFQIDVESGEATAVIVGDGLGPLAGWSPDRTKAYFNRSDAVVERDVASGSERVVHRQAIRLAQVSPDGRYVFGTGRIDPSTGSSFLVVPVAGGQPLELFRVTVDGGFSPGPFQWTPDSSGVMAIKWTGSRRDLWLFPVTGGQPRRLDIDPDIWMAGASGNRTWGFNLSPDGRSIAFQTGKVAAEIWALENFLPAAPARR